MLKSMYEMAQALLRSEFVENDFYSGKTRSEGGGGYDLTVDSAQDESHFKRKFDELYRCKR